MATSLILALLSIAGLGVLALVLIFFGGFKKRDNKVKTKSIVKKENTLVKPKKLKEDITQDENEPYFTAPALKAVKKIKEQDEVLVDPTIASLGFSAIDDLLAEPESLKAVFEEVPIVEEEPTTPIKKNVRKTQKKTITLESDVIILYVLAQPERPFVGYELMQSLSAAGLRFGEMNIFHYYTSEEKNAQIIFSLSSAVEPGIFDVSNVGAICCPGLSLFMRVSATEYPDQVFTLMLETAQQLADDLGGELCDHTRQPLTIETVTEYQTKLQQINEAV